MRNLGKTLLAASVAFVLVGLAGGQQGGGGIFGGGGGGQNDPVSLLRNPAVKKELDLTDEQAEKIPDAVRKVLTGVLSEKQQARLWQIELQQRGTAAFQDPRVQKELKITDDQVSSIKTIVDDSRKEMAELFKEAKGGGGKGLGEKFAAARKETTEKIQGVLTADQRKQYKQMIGEEFKMPQGGFGGGNFKKKAKADL